jgi:PKD repeat protein
MLTRFPDRRPRSLLLLFAILVPFAAGCDRLPLTAPTGSTITLFSTAGHVPLNGETEIVAAVIEQPGTPVHNGTLVTFTTTVGTIEPREARTHNGQVRVRLLSAGESGTARVQAFSGAAASEPLEIPVGAAAADRLLLSASPGSIAAGATTQIVARVLDPSGNPIPGVPVTFSADAGTIAPSTVTTDGSGEARAALTTTRQTTVTATAGAQTQTVTVAIAEVATVAISAPASVTVGVPATFTVQVTAPANAAPVQSVSVNFGDGTVRNLGAVTTTTTVQHVYTSPGTYTVTAQVTDVTGAQRSSSTVIVTQGATLNLTFSPSTPTVGNPVTFTATAAGTTISTYNWDFGDGTTAQTTTNTRAHTYTEPGTRTVTVTAVPLSGTPITAQITLTVTNP